MKSFVVIILISILSFLGCSKSTEESKVQPIRMDKNMPNFKSETKYNLQLSNLPDSDKWLLELDGYKNYLDTSFTARGDTIVSLVHADLAVPEIRSEDILDYDSSIVSIEGYNLIPVSPGKTIVIYKHPKGIDTTFIIINKTLQPSISQE